MWIGGGFDGFEDGVGSRLFPTMVEDLLYHLLRDVRSRYLVFRCVFRWMPFRMSAAACMSEKSGGDPILRHVPSSEVFDKMKRPCDLSTCPHHKTRVVRYGAYGFEVLGCGPLYLVKVAFCIRLYVFCFVFGLGPLDLVHLIKSRWKKKKEIISCFVINHNKGPKKKVAKDHTTCHVSIRLGVGRWVLPLELGISNEELTRQNPF